MQWLRKLWRKIQKLWTKKPRKVTNVEVYEDMGTVTLNWELNGRQGGQALNPANAWTLVEMSADGGANFVALNTVAGDAAQEAVITELEPGTYQFRLTVLDQMDQSSPPHLEAATINPNAPNAVTNVTVTVE